MPRWGIIDPKSRPLAVIRWARPYRPPRGPRLSLPSAFCWSKIGTEAGESIDSILERKDEERAKGNGTFLWGIGNSIGPSLRSLLEVEREPCVVFSPMRTPAAQRDVTPDVVVTWQSAFAFDGGAFEMPLGTTVTSSLTSRRRHYALVCRREDSLRGSDDDAWIDDRQLRNLRTGSPVGASQVTSVVCAVDGTDQAEPRYGIAFRARLEAPYLVVLEDPIALRDGNGEGDDAAVPAAMHPDQGRLAL